MGKDAALGRNGEALADVVYRNDDLAASVSSGSFVTDGMIVIPCSMASASAIAYSMNQNLLVRAAVVCLKPGAELSIIELQAHVRSRLAGFKVPTQINFIDDRLPRNPSGKILKRQLRDEFLADEPG